MHAVASAADSLQPCGLSYPFLPTYFLPHLLDLKTENIYILFNDIVIQRELN